MKTLYFGACILAGVFVGGAALAQDVSVGDDELGLAGSVFDIEDPLTFAYSSADPDDDEITTVPITFVDQPPAVPHSIEEYKEMTLKRNKCLKCHDDPDLWGEEKAEDDPSPMPESHYVDFRREPGVVKPQIIGTRYFCLQCHVPQAEVELLVENNF